MLDYPIAVIADVHGNRWALEAVLEDIERRSIRETVNLGDCLYGPLQPAATCELLLRLAIPTVAGNEDRIIIDPRQPPSPTLLLVRAELEEQHLDWLRGLPMTRTLHSDTLLCHGSPRRDDQYLLWDITETGARLRTTADIAALLPPGMRMVLCGHDHVPRVLNAGPTLVINPGSVGLPAYSDDHPFDHVMETGSPHARYAVISESEQGIRVEDIAVPYDWQSAARTAAANGRPDWQTWLTTGRAG